jgi:hypothetical protein
LDGILGRRHIERLALEANAADEQDHVPLGNGDAERAIAFDTGRDSPLHRHLAARDSWAVTESVTVPVMIRVCADANRVPRNSRAAVNTARRILI